MKRSPILRFVLACALLVALAVPSSAAGAQSVAQQLEECYGDRLDYYPLSRLVLIDDFLEVFLPERYQAVYDRHYVFVEGPCTLTLADGSKEYFRDGYRGPALLTSMEAYWADKFQLYLDTGLVQQGELNNLDLFGTMRRQEAAVILTRMAQGLGLDTGVRTDSSSITDWDMVYSGCREGVQAACALGLMQTNADGTFDPYLPMDNGEGLAALQNLVSLMERQGGDPERWNSKNISLSCYMDEPYTMNKGIAFLPESDWSHGRMTKVLSKFKEIAARHCDSKASIYWGSDAMDGDYIQLYVESGNQMVNRFQQGDYLQYTVGVDLLDAFPEYSCGYPFSPDMDETEEVIRAYFSQITSPKLTDRVVAMCRDLYDRQCYYAERYEETYDSKYDFDLWMRTENCYGYDLGDGILVGFDFSYVTLYPKEYNIINDFFYYTYEEFPWFNEANRIP